MLCFLRVLPLLVVRLASSTPSHLFSNQTVIYSNKIRKNDFICFSWMCLNLWFFAYLFPFGHLIGLKNVFIWSRLTICSNHNYKLLIYMPLTTVERVQYKIDLLQWGAHELRPVNNWTLSTLRHTHRHNHWWVIFFILRQRNAECQYHIVFSSTCGFRCIIELIALTIIYIYICSLFVCSHLQHNNV